MKIDSKFFNQQWFRAIAAEFGPDGQIAVIHILVSIFESPRGYWRSWELVDCFEVINSIPGLTLERLNKIVERLTQYGIFDRGHLMIQHPVLTSAYLQREFIRQCGTARARRLRWTDHPVLTPRELLEMGVIAAVDESQTDTFGRPCVDPDEPIGVPIPLPRNHPLHDAANLCCIRIPSPDPHLHVYRPIHYPRRADATWRICN